jgi:hypothetical protein
VLVAGTDTVAGPVAKRILFESRPSRKVARAR